MKAKYPTNIKLPPTSGVHTAPYHPFTSGTAMSMSKRRGSDRSLSGSTHELALPSKTVHSHSQSNITDIANR